MANPPKPPVPVTMTEEEQEGTEAAAEAQADKAPVQLVTTRAVCCFHCTHLLFQDPYAKFPLPYVIGTVEFHEDDYCGLFVLSEGIITLSFQLESTS